MIGGVLLILLDLLGHGEQRALVQNTPPQVVCMVQLHFSRGDLGSFRPRKTLKMPQPVLRSTYRAIYRVEPTASTLGTLGYSSRASPGPRVPRVAMLH